MADTRKELDLKWVKYIIGEHYKSWKPADVIIIESQTGTGKTCFVQNILIPYISSYKKKLLFVCNRTNLKRQIKKDLLTIHNQEIPKSL
jgi:Rad3-related DNA helicase